MNRLPASPTCRICDLNMRVRWAVAPTVTAEAEWARQIENGMCDACQIKRQTAAIEYENAAAEVRLMEWLGAKVAYIGARTPGNRVMHQANDRVELANEQCIALRMWPADRATSKPGNYYREES